MGGCIQHHHIVLKYFTTSAKFLSSWRPSAVSPCSSSQAEASFLFLWSFLFLYFNISCLCLAQISSERFDSVDFLSSCFQLHWLLLSFLLFHCSSYFGIGLPIFSNDPKWKFRWPILYLFSSLTHSWSAINFPLNIACATLYVFPFLSDSNIFWDFIFDWCFTLPFCNL